jgi:Uma2 family endonuclease
MAVEEKLYTAEDLLKLSEADDSKRYELVEGKLIEMSPTGATHGILANEVAFIITAFVRSANLGYVFSAETGFRLSINPDTVRAPDVAFVAKERMTAKTDGYLDLAPDLAVEVVSPGNTLAEIHEKVIEYFRAGTRLVWALFPKSRAIYVYRAANQITVLGIDDVLEGDDVLPGFKVSVRDIFAVLDK